jgi:hypothetical protein
MEVIFPNRTNVSSGVLPHPASRDPFFSHKTVARYDTFFGHVAQARKLRNFCLRDVLHSKRNEDAHSSSDATLFVLPLHYPATAIS